MHAFLNLSVLVLIRQLLWMAICMAFVGQLREGPFKQRLHYQVYTSCFQLLGGSLSAVITHHNQENKATRGICVANHTSPIDVLVMACDNAYALVSLRILIPFRESILGNRF